MDARRGLARRTLKSNRRGRPSLPYLLQEELSITLRGFKSGRDQGIELRYSIDEKKTLIVQCKHFAGMLYSTY